MKKEKFKPVDLSSLYHVRGLSVVDPRSNQSHRLVRAKYLPKTRGYRLDYSMLAVPFKNNPYDGLSGDFFSNIEKSKTDKSSRVHAENKYDIFIKNNFFSYHKDYLVTYQPKPTITFQYELDQHMEVVNESVYATAGKVIKHIDYYNANRSLEAHQPNQSLAIWLECMQARTGNLYLNHYDETNFAKLIEDSTTMIQETSLRYCINNGVETVVLIKKEDLDQETDIKAVKSYMSISELDNRGVNPLLGKMPVSPNYSDSVSLLNNAILHYALTRPKDENKNIFLPEDISCLAMMAGGRVVTRKNPRAFSQEESDTVYSSKNHDLILNAAKQKTRSFQKNASDAFPDDEDFLPLYSRPALVYRSNPR